MQSRLDFIPRASLVGRHARFVLAAFALLIPMHRASSQRPRPNPGHVASVNPFVLLFGYVSGEYEQRVRETLGIALGGSYVKFDNDRYTNINLTARFYPTEHALEGLGLGASAGYTQVDNKYDDYYGCTFDNCQVSARTETLASPTVAIEITYQWLLGSHKSTAFTIGGGARRLLRESPSVSQLVPTGRLTIGYAW